MEENNKKENIANKINEVIQKSINIIVEKLEKIEKVDTKKSEQMNGKLESLYNRIKEGKLNTFEILYEIIEFQNELVNFLDSDDYKQKTMEVQQREFDDKKEDNSLQVYVKPKSNILEKLKQLIAKFFRKLAKEGAME